MPAAPHASRSPRRRSCSSARDTRVVLVHSVRAVRARRVCAVRAHVDRAHRAGPFPLAELAPFAPVVLLLARVVPAALAPCPRRSSASCGRLNIWLLAAEGRLYGSLTSVVVVLFGTGKDT